MKSRTGYKIFHKIFFLASALGNDFSEFSASFGLTEMEVRFIFSIGSGNNKISDLIYFFKKHKSTITQKINSLEKKGYITVEHSTADKRERTVILTQKGKRLHTQMVEIKESYKKKVFASFSKKEEEELLKLLEKLELQKYHENIC